MTSQQLEQLLASLSTEEKVLQLCQIDISFFLSEAAAATGPMAEFSLSPEKMACIGSVICGGNADAAAFADLQAKMIERSPHHIPAVIMSDVIHGMRTIFPIPLAMACAFDPAVAETAARVSAAEAAACGIHVTFAPMADMARDPRWGRCMEGAGESVTLGADMAAAMVRGFRGESLADSTALACCAKHFAAYGLVEAGREYAPVDVSHTELFNVYFPPFQAALKAGCDLVMPAFTPIDREPAVMNRWLMQNVLRERWGFDGAVISDWDAPAELVLHGVAQNKRQAAALCMAAGLDMDMMGMAYLSALKGLVDDGTVPMQALDTAVRRILRLKNELGLFKTPCKNTSAKTQQAVCTAEAHRKAALDAALKSCVLLKNEAALPLAGSRKIALAGEFADSHAILGGWSAGGREDETPSLRDVFPEACAVADADTVLFAAGEPQAETGEAASKVNPALSAAQAEALRVLHEQGKQTVLILFCARPFILTEVLPYCDAVLVAWFPGSAGARALRMLLTGEVSPSGHLSMTFPRSVGQIPIHHDSLTTARPEFDGPNNHFVSRYCDSPLTPLFPFGFGLSYTEFSVGPATVSTPALTGGETLAVSCDVQNTGDCDGETVLQLYLACEHSPRMHPQRELKAYQRVALARGETRRVTLCVPADALAFFDAEGRAELPQSRWFAAVGESSAAPFTAEFQTL